MLGADKQIGCLSRLFPFSIRRRAGRSTTDLALKSGPSSGIPDKSVDVEAEETPSEKPELPPNANFVSTCCCSPGDYTVHPRRRMERPPSYSAEAIFRPEIVATIEGTLEQLDPELRKLSLDIWSHPELGYEEYRTHDTLTTFMTEHGFDVTPHYLGLATAWRAVFKHRADASSRVIGVNSEMDALPGIGHACGHNLIAIAGVGVALALRAAMKKHDVPGTVVLLGTPAEETTGGKVKLLELGAYEEMDVCVMCHPSAGLENTASLGPCLACQVIEIEFFGHTAHAAWAPWEGQNALDAAFLAYNAVSVLRQQIHPTHRVHGTVSGRDWAPNVIPDYAKMRWIVRAPSYAELEVLRERVRACFEAAALATACKLKVVEIPAFYDLRQNPVLGEEFAHIVSDRDGMTAEFDEGMGASTDFGNVTYALPSLHPGYAIPTVPNGRNHTAQFTQSASTPAAHAATLKVVKGLAAASFRVLDDNVFYEKVRKAWVNTKSVSA
ncbi:amidohydrolase [Amylocystis lapponica]|nr:amidohydrolase [Amylocystis lapponica]